jgi:hypothetical protein
MGGGGTEWDQKRPTVLTQICSDVDIGEKKKWKKEPVRDAGAPERVARGRLESGSGMDSIPRV